MANHTVRIDCPLAGEHQVENALTAAAALTELGVPAGAIEQGIAQARWPGRLEHICERLEMILDGAHNPAGARALAAYIDRFYRGKRIWLIYGDKAIVEISELLFPRAGRVVVTAPQQARAALPETTRELTYHPDVLVATRLAEALELARDAAADVVLVTGSLFLIGEAKALMATG